VLSALILPGLAQQADVSVVGGGGVSSGEDQDSFGITAVGASFGLPYSSRHRVQFDYLFNNQHGGSAFNLPANRHFITASYVVQGKAGRTRPFFQAGAGIVQWNVEGYRQVGTNKVLYLSESDTSFAAVFGGGATIDLGKSLFIRPQVRLYGNVGLTITVIPSVAFGWRF